MGDGPVAGLDGGIMSNTKWVRHISGQGEKWEVWVDSESSWITRTPYPETRLFLPKSEYILCEPPERWEDVTSTCSLTASHDLILHGQFVIDIHRGYRLRKVQIFSDAEGMASSSKNPFWAFIVERKVQP